MRNVPIQALVLISTPGSMVAFQASGGLGLVGRTRAPISITMPSQPPKEFGTPKSIMNVKRIRSSSKDKFQSSALASSSSEEEQVGNIMKSIEGESKIKNKEDEPKCPVTIYSNRVSNLLKIFDTLILRRIIRIGNHMPALLSLSYFGLISMASMMSMGPMVNSAGAAEATLSSVLVSTVGPTTNASFAAMFPTLVTPAPFVFLVWPLIAVLQLITVSVSALFPFGNDSDGNGDLEKKENEFLTQGDLTALTFANLASAAWLFASSNASVGYLPIASFLVLPFVPLFSGYPLRNKPRYVLWAYQVYSAFTTIASILAFTVEIQHGGRIPTWLPFVGATGKVGAEVAGMTFLSLFSLSSLAVKYKSGAKKLVNFGALSGILTRRVMTAVATTGGFLSGVSSLLLSFSFLGTVGCWIWSVQSFTAPTE